MSTQANPPKQAKTTVRPYLDESLLTAARKCFPQLEPLSDRQFIEFVLSQAMAGVGQAQHGLAQPTTAITPINALPATHHVSYTHQQTQIEETTNDTSATDRAATTERASSNEQRLRNVQPLHPDDVAQEMY